MRKSRLINKGGPKLAKSTLNRGPSTLSQKANLQKKTSRLNPTKASLTVHAKEGSTRQVGDKSEARMKNKIECDSIKIEDTRNSGALYYDGDFKLILSDVEGDYIRCEGKYRNTDGFTVSKKHWKEIKEKSLKHGGTPALVNENKEGEVLITMSLKQLSHIIGKHV